MPELTLYRIEVKESNKSRSYWAADGRFHELEEGLRSADILILPWENFREDEQFLYPQGTADFCKKLSNVIDQEVLLVALEGQYSEIALHSKCWRVPTIMLNKVLLPAAGSLLAMAIYGALDSVQENDSVEINLLVEGDNGQCFEFSYKGPPSRSIDSLLNEAENCFPDVGPLPRLNDGDASKAIDDETGKIV